MDIQTIIDYRKEQRGKCVSTTHGMSTKEFTTMLPALQKRYQNFKAEFYDGKLFVDEVKVTIQMHKTKS